MKVQMKILTCFYLFWRRMGIDRVLACYTKCTNASRPYYVLDVKGVRSSRSAVTGIPEANLQDRMHLPTVTLDR